MAPIIKRVKRQSDTRPPSRTHPHPPHTFGFVAANGEMNRPVMSICAPDLYNTTLICLWEPPVPSVIKRSSRLAHKPPPASSAERRYRSRSDSLLVFTSSRLTPINHIYESRNYLIRLARWGPSKPVQFITACNHIQMACEVNRTWMRMLQKTRWYNIRCKILSKSINMNQFHTKCAHFVMNKSHFNLNRSQNLALRPWIGRLYKRKD